MKRDAEEQKYRDTLQHLRAARYHLRVAASEVDTLPGCSNREWRKYMAVPVAQVDEIGVELTVKAGMRKLEL